LRPLSLSLSLSIYIYIFKTAAQCAYTSFKNNSFRGRLRGGRRKKESSLPSPPPLHCTVLVVSEGRGHLEVVVLVEGRGGGERGSRYESRARNVSGCQVLMMINELGSSVCGRGVRCTRNTTRIYFYGGVYFFSRFKFSLYRIRLRSGAPVFPPAGPAVLRARTCH